MLVSTSPLGPIPAVSAVPFHFPIFIQSNADFTAENGVVSGNGTVQNPYLIEGWWVFAEYSTNPGAAGIQVQNTNASFVIRNVKVQFGRSCYYNGMTDCDGIDFYNVSNARVENSSIVNDNFGGIYVDSSANVTISNNTISNNYAGAVSLSSCKNVTVQNNVISNNGSGIYATSLYYSKGFLSIGSSSGITITGNSVLDNSDGIGTDFSRDVKVSNNTVMRNSSSSGGITVCCENMNLTGNAVSQNGGVGIGVAPSFSPFPTPVGAPTRPIISGNLVASNGVGIEISQATGGTISSNNVTANIDHGIHLDRVTDEVISNNHIAANGGSNIYLTGSGGNLLYHNDFVQTRQDSGQAVDDQGDQNSWDAGYPSGGNYWSDFIGVDQCSGPLQNVCLNPDGIGDTSYTFPVGARDRYPLVKPFNSASILVNDFFTDLNASSLHLDAKGNPTVDVLLTEGRVRSTSPRQVLAWTKITNVGGPLQSLKLNDTLPTDWTIHPSWMPGMGAITTFFESANGTLTDITNETRITVTSGNPQTISLSIANMTATGEEKPLNRAESILLSAKLSYSLIGTAQASSTYPRNYNDTTSASAWTRTSFNGNQASANSLTFFTAYARVPGDVNSDLHVDILDVALVAYAYGSGLGDARWNQAADLNNDGTIDILDAALVAFCFGTHA